MNTDPARPQVTTKHEALDRQMTLDEVAAFVQDAMRAGHSGASVVKVRARMSGGIADLRITSRPAAR